MKRKEFLTKGIFGLGGVVPLTSVIASKNGHGDIKNETVEECAISPQETKGPFPNKIPEDYVRENIIEDRKGVPMLMTLTILNKNNNCKPMDNALVDVWHCDNHGKYSQYGDNWGQSEDLTKAHFLRGRQISDAKGRVSFVSIFPGYYRGRAPHVHLEVFDAGQKSVLVTQIAFPEEIYDIIYTTENYQGTDYVSNTRDGIFRDSLEYNMADSVNGNSKQGYTLLKSIVVKA